MTDWLPIETAPKDGTEILLYWPAHTYDVDGESEPLVAIGRWKLNTRLMTEYSDGTLVRDAAKKKAEFEQYGISASYFSDTAEQDDYGLAQNKHAPTKWKHLQG